MYKASKAIYININNVQETQIGIETNIWILHQKWELCTGI